MYSMQRASPEEAASVPVVMVHSKLQLLEQRMYSSSQEIKQAMCTRMQCASPGAHLLPEVF